MSADPKPTGTSPLIPPEMPFCHTVKLNFRGDIVDESYTVRAASWDKFQANDTEMGKVVARRQLELLRLQPKQTPPPADGQQPKTDRMAAKPPDARGAEEEEVDSFCELHGVDMTPHEKDGEIWYSHKAKRKDGSPYWCRGKAEKRSRK
jgi:hypothetical protein